MKGGDPRNGQAKKGTTRTRGWQPKETASQLPRKAILSNQRGCCTQGEGTQGPWRRGATGCCRSSRQLLARVRVDGRMRRPVRLLRRTPGQARQRTLPSFSFTPKQLRLRVGLHHLDLLHNCSSQDVTPMTECHAQEKVTSDFLHESWSNARISEQQWLYGRTLRAVRAES